jgi:fatty-acyl-CoA synthase
VPETGWRLNYRELDDGARRFAQWLANHAHLRAGDIVALIAQNRAEALLLYLACGKLGLILAPISYRLAATDQVALLERISPQLLVIDSALDNPLEGAQGVLNDCRHFGIGGDDCDYTREVAVLASEPINNALPMAQTSLLVHTGGSTGLPKICAVSYRQMLWNAFELMSAAPEGLGNRREMVLFPLYHIGGWNTVW